MATYLGDTLPMKGRFAIMMRQVYQRFFALMLIGFVLLFEQTILAQDLFVASGAGTTGVLRYDGNTGEFLENFTQVGHPIGVTFGPDGNLYIADRNGNNVKRVDVVNRFVSDFTPYAGGDVFNLRFGPDGSLFVADFTNGRILKYSGATGEFLGVFISGLTRLGDFCFGPEGNIYVSVGVNDPASILRYNGTTGVFIDSFIPEGVV
jgi:sugar lactone lactonase YvrE